MWKLTVFTVLCISSTGLAQNVTSLAGRPVAPNCPPLEPRTFATLTTGKICQFIISLDSRGCRQISQDCSAKELFCKNTNEAFWQCSQRCEPTCSNPNPTCESSCGEPKCQCSPGTLRDSRGNCVPRDQCSSNNPPAPQCQFGEVLALPNCNNRVCEQTCTGQSNCNPNCNQPFCVCAEGTVRDMNSRRCMPRGQCPSNNPPGCTRDDHCNGNSRICQNGRCVDGCTSNSQCGSGLQCRSGRCSIPTCDRDSHCTPGTICLGNRCTAGCRTFSDCGNGFACVENQCRRVIAPNPPQCRSDNNCPGNSICEGFRCRPGCRNDRQCSNNFNCVNTQCVPRGRPECFNDRDCGHNRRCFQGRCHQNFPSRCDQGEEFTSCGSSCEPTCSNPNPICTLRCVSRCQCIRGLVRNRFGRCVPRQFC